MRPALLALYLYGALGSEVRSAEELYAAERGLKSVPPTRQGAPLELRVGFYVESLGTIRASEMVMGPAGAGGEEPAASPDPDAPSPRGPVPPCLFLLMLQRYSLTNAVALCLCAPYPYALINVVFNTTSEQGFCVALKAFDMDMYFRLNWRDERLRHGGQGFRTLSKENAGNIWYPDLFFANAKTAAYQSVTMANSAVYVHPSGDIAYSARILLNLACNLDLVQYPLDEQECHVKIMSYAMPSSLLNVSWFSSRPLSRNPAIDLPEFSLVDVRADYCDGDFEYAVTERQNQIGNFSCLLAKLFLQRSVGYHIVQTFVPTGLIVIISWVSFWIDATAVPARVSLSFTTLLTLATQGAGIRFAIPAVSYAKAIDFWFGMCMTFVFAALIEFAAVNSLMRSAKKLDDLASAIGPPPRLASQHSCSEGPSPEEPSVSLSPALLRRRPSAWPKAQQNYANAAALSRRESRKALRVDVACRYCFPSAFFLFNCVYWTYYGFF